ncbi:MFS transporter, partial [Candidatus Marsarchaeota G2 archaeon ECH_B_SAG-G16]
MQVLLTLATVALLVNYVETMVVPALPTIQSDFSTTSSLVAWVTSAYLIVGSAASPLFGKLGDLYGKKRLYLISLGFYIISVALAGFSTNIYFLIFARAL